ncbi:hypothetical protein AALA61_13010 [Oscillospiraceae bacterium 42-9]
MSQLKIYEGEVNIGLLNDIVAFVLETAGAGHPQRQLVRGRCLFYDNASSGDSLQDKYGFLYLGELLERYEARFGMALCDLRAIALALGYTMELLTDEMFVGSQRGDFLRKVRQQSQGDIYLTAAHYLLADEKDAARWERTLLGTRYTKTEELLFAMSVLPDFAQAEQALRPQLNALLGAGRTLPVIGNTRLFDWLISHALPHIKAMRGKDTALLRALCALPGSYVKPGSRPWGVLESQGYTAFETACLNTRAALTLEGGLGPDSLVTEKIVVGLFKTALGQPDPLPEEVYQSLERLFYKYSRFRIKCYGCGTLPDALKEDVQIQEPAAFAWFAGLAGVEHPALAGFDILDPKWDSLAAAMKPEKYRALFGLSLTEAMPAEDLKARAARYDQLTGNSFQDACAGERYSLYFPLLVNKGLLDLWQCFQDSLDSGGNVQNPDTLDNIRRYLRGIGTAQAYRFYQRFFQEYGMPGLKRFWDWGHRDFKESLFRASRSCCSGSEPLHLQRDFLDGEGQRQLLDWLQDYCFFYEPEKYPGLVVAILRDGFAPGLLSPAEQRALFDLAAGRMQLQGWVVQALKSKYLTEEEQRAGQAALAVQEQEEAERKRQESLRALRDEYACAESMKAVLKYLENYRYYREKQAQACRIVSEGLPGRLDAAAYCLEPGEQTALLSVYALLLNHRTMAWTEIQGEIQKIKEECENDHDSRMRPAC